MLAHLKICTIVYLCCTLTLYKVHFIYVGMEALPDIPHKPFQDDLTHVV